VAETLQQAHPTRRPIAAVRADVTDATSMRALADSTRLVVTAVGPFSQHGTALVKACALGGTDYVDITGEPEFVDRAWLDCHEAATRSGARLVHCCGFDSVPHDLGVWWTLRFLPSDVPLRVAGYVRASAGVSAGTFHSAVRAIGQTRQARTLARRRRRAERGPQERHVGALPLRPHREPSSGRWALPLPTIDPVIVRRSARVLAEYGPDFRYGHFFVAGGLPATAGVVATAGAVAALAQFPPARAALLRLRTAGDGPSKPRRARSWFRVRFVAWADGSPVVTEVAGGDPGYDETATMLGESALCLAYDDLPTLAGQLTPTQAMGDALGTRLMHAGITFRRVEAGRVTE